MSTAKRPTIRDSIGPAITTFLVIAIVVMGITTLLNFEQLTEGAFGREGRTHGVGYTNNDRRDDLLELWDTRREWLNDAYLTNNAVMKSAERNRWQFRDESVVFFQSRLTYPRPSLECWRCRGTGEHPKQRGQDCDKCWGIGREPYYPQDSTLSYVGSEQRCTQCDGRGWPAGYKACQHCSGRGSVPKNAAALTATERDPTATPEPTLDEIPAPIYSETSPDGKPTTETLTPTNTESTNSDPFADVEIPVPSVVSLSSVLGHMRTPSKNRLSADGSPPELIAVFFGDASRPETGSLQSLHRFIWMASEAWGGQAKPDWYADCKPEWLELWRIVRGGVHYRRTLELQGYRDTQFQLPNTDAVERQAELVNAAEAIEAFKKRRSYLEGLLEDGP